MPLVEEDATDLLSAPIVPSAALVVALKPRPASAAALRRASTQSSGQSIPTSRPRARSRSSSFTSALQRVEYVEVKAKLRRQGHSLYVVDVYLLRRSDRQRLSDCAYHAAPASSLSVEALDDLMRAERESDYRVEHRFADFVALRNALQTLGSGVLHPKGSAQCSTCRELAAFAAKRQHQAWPLKRIFSTEKARRALLTRFVNAALELAAGFEEDAEDAETKPEMADDAPEKDRSCPARTQAVALVEDFLRKPFESSLGII